MTKLFIELKKSNRKNNPMDIEIIQFGYEYEIKEVLLYAMRAVIEEEKELESFGLRRY